MINTAKILAKLKGEDLIIPKEVVYIYALYFYPILFSIALIFTSKILDFIIVIICTVPYLLASMIFSWTFLDFIGIGSYLTFLFALALLLQPLLKYKFPIK